MDSGFLIFNRNRKLEILSHKLEQNVIEADGEIFYPVEKQLKQNIAAFVDKFEGEHYNKLIIRTAQPEKIFKLVKEHYDKYVLAGGGIVLNAQKKVLVIFRNGKWDLPKGKIKKKEAPLDGAIREVQEETGLENLVLEDDLSCTYHSYQEKGKNILKKTYWYLFATTDTKTQPQEEEGITKVEWLKQQDLDQVFENTYPNIEKLLKNFLRKKNF